MLQRPRSWLALRATISTGCAANGTPIWAANLAPSQHTEEPIKRILGGVTSVVEGLGSLRNKMGDAHGQGKKAVRPSARHA
jgi:Abortive infection C-terminus